MTISATQRANDPADPMEYPIWNWRGFPIRYQKMGQIGPTVLLIHGFGGSVDHWRKNLPVMGQCCRCYALDLIGFGGSAKPTPGVEVEYRFETWSEQIIQFCQEVIGEPTVLVGNSIGCIAVMQAAVDASDWVESVVLINCSLRLLHDRRRENLPFYKRYGAPIVQRFLGIRAIGHWFFAQIAKPKVVRQILQEAYGRSEAVTDELVDLLMAPALDPGAADVFIAFTRYSQGPLPEELLESLPCPALMLWGTEDPWEPIDEGRKLGEFPAIKHFIPLEGVGHCPQDEAPELVNPLILDWVLENSDPLN
ncbi:alpha/beta fold hydrolase [Roseofilum reptotaenium CS-1145]|uniref:Alpha/beta hydrolase n=2 Tax=Roseofilum TaxID=1233426 RepID=A0A1L9QXD0_9CYAN|nr:alpha/beta fold hydrolase [Roseofilum reptotaenium CS-1145]OJJ27338.1 alpha/beta hydrolase [Roseofilum reptotaenium AO1-A]